MKCGKRDMLLYAVTDRRWLGRRSLYGQVEQSLEGGVTMVQLREKDLGREAFLEEAREIGRLCRHYQVPFLVNDDVGIALEAGADGVHIGQEDMGIREARERLGPDKIIGVSAHNVQEAVEAWEGGADYLGAGAVFSTGSKGDVTPLDHGVLQAICGAVDIPVVAIGGISQQNIMALRGRGLSGVAVVSAIFAQEDIRAAAARLRAMAEEMVTI